MKVSSKRTSRKAVEVWGPAAWTWLHTVAFDYARDATPYDRQQAYAFLDSFTRAIPCPSCRRHWTQVIAADVAAAADSDIFVGRDSYARATVAWHNRMNEYLGKPVVPYEQVVREFEEAEEEENDCAGITSGRPATMQRLLPPPIPYPTGGGPLVQPTGRSTGSYAQSAGPGLLESAVLID